MARSNKIDVYLEVGAKRTFAGALGWPGWCRSGKDEESALKALFEYGPRYGRVVGSAKLGFSPPGDVTNLVVVERLKGNATTDFGAPGVAPSADSEPVDPEELHTFRKVLKACWRTMDKSIRKAEGTSLRSGPRGGGRQVDKIVQHLLESDGGYLNAVGWKRQGGDAMDAGRQLERTRQAILEALEASVRGEIPARGPRGGVRWTARYFVRRLAWHTLDHAWEIEDRLGGQGA